MAELTHPTVESLDVTAVLFALSDPARLAIVRQLSGSLQGAPDLLAEPITCQAVALDMPKSTRSHHLKTLRESGIVHMETRGREKILTLRRDELEARWPGLLSAVLEDRTVDSRR